MRSYLAREDGFTGAEKALLTCFALGLIALVGYLAGAGNGRAAAAAARTLSTQAAPTGPWQAARPFVSAGDLPGAGGGGASRASAGPPAGTCNGTYLGGVPLNQGTFRTTHNSYAVHQPITAQLDEDVRALELDVQDNDYGDHGDYRVGHDEAGDRVYHGHGNPSGDGLRDWLGAVRGWHDAHPDHTPIIITLDLKDDLTDNRRGQGDLSTLNATLRGAFGDALFVPADLPRAEWPTVDQLRGRVIVVLSGDGGTRRRYWDRYHGGADEVAFVEAQPGDGEPLRSGAWFASAGVQEECDFWVFGCDSHDGDKKFLRDAHGRGRLTRAWEVGEGDKGVLPYTSLPGTGDPTAGWYQSLCAV